MANLINGKTGTCLYFYKNSVFFLPSLGIFLNSFVLNNRPVVFQPQSQPRILIEYILIKEKAC